ncbi:hypothetical protein DENSPDRAFT_9940 [Dentipellis sp. KUC8613]|nr:hypothetical protein DENSPDRAFT_9940 [Dentipellis sp. KUC8613]
MEQCNATVLNAVDGNEESTVAILKATTRRQQAGAYFLSSTLATTGIHPRQNVCTRTLSVPSRHTNSVGSYSVRIAESMRELSPPTRSDEPTQASSCKDNGPSMRRDRTPVLEEKLGAEARLSNDPPGKRDGHHAKRDEEVGRDAKEEDVREGSSTSEKVIESSSDASFASEDVASAPHEVPEDDEEASDQEDEDDEEVDELQDDSDEDEQKPGPSTITTLHGLSRPRTPEMLPPISTLVPSLPPLRSRPPYATLPPLPPLQPMRYSKSLDRLPSSARPSQSLKRPRALSDAPIMSPEASKRQKLLLPDTSRWTPQPSPPPQTHIPSTPPGPAPQFGENTEKYICPLCGRALQRPPDLRRHMESIHGNQKAFHCEPCDAYFNRSDAFLRHKKSSKKHLCIVAKLEGVSASP